MTDQTAWYRVRLELKRIQTWLFLVPKLKTILGANTLLGEFVRIECPKLVGEPRFGKPPDLAAGGAPKKIDDDPLQGGEWEADDPASAYGKGVLARDGGHFHALFNDETCAKNFGRELAERVARDLPGIVFEVAVERWADTPDPPSWQRIETRSGAVTTLLQPPSLPACQLSGDGLATDTVQPPEGEPVAVSRRVKRQWEAGERFAASRKGATGAQDIVSLLQKTGRMALDDLQAPADFKQISGKKDRYLALIHADGNNVGTRSEAARGSAKPASFDEWLKAEAQGEGFFHGMRVAVRKALIEALSAAFPASEFPSETARPYQVLMLGGDDLLLLCRASHALRFSLEYARALKSQNLTDGKPLGAGVGVAIFPPNLPFHRMHDLAEELADSAKRIARADGATPGESVIDWMVVSQSATLGVAEHRRRFDSLRYREPGGNAEMQLALTAKPYPIRARTGSDWSLERLLAAAVELGKTSDQGGTTAARSQMKSLPALLRRGYHAGIFAAHDLPDAIKNALANCLPSEFPEKDKMKLFPWAKIGQDAQAKRYRTLLADLFEIVEIPRLGRGPATKAGAGDPSARPSEAPIATEERAA